jgi:hypothetical protein
MHFQLTANNAGFSSKIRVCRSTSRATTRKGPKEDPNKACPADLGSWRCAVDFYGGGCASLWAAGAVGCWSYRGASGGFMRRIQAQGRKTGEVLETNMNVVVSEETISMRIVFNLFIFFVVA